MDDSFDNTDHVIDVQMSGANGNGNNQQGRGGNKNGPRLCHTCNQPGHMRANCPQNQNNGGGNNRNNYNNNGRQGQNANGGNRQNKQRAQGGRGGNGNGNGNNQNNNNNNNAQQGQNGRGGNNNAQRGQNGRRGQQNENDDNDNEPNLEGSQPDGPCYRHGPGHTNNVCNDSRNIWGPDHNGGNNGNQPQQQNRQQNQNQNQQRAPQENRHGNPRRNYVPENNVRPEYCERCNKRGHTSLVCEAPRMGARQIMMCSLCNTPGHTHTVCRNPAYCANCWGSGHSKEQCRRPRADHTFFHTNEDTDLVDADSVCSSSSDHSSTYSSLSQSRRSSVQTHFQLPQRNNNGITKAYFANANGDLVLEAPLDEISAQIAAIAAEKENIRRHAIAAKCCGAHARYSMRLLNDEIASGARFLGGVDPANPQIPLPRGMERTAALEHLFQFWINDDAFGKAAEFVRKGWNFFRDPRVLDAIARSSAPVCHCCKNKGHILSATFTELVPGTDVLTVEEYDLWGPSVMFSCQCSVNGYSFMRAEDGRMDVQFM